MKKNWKKTITTVCKQNIVRLQLKLLAYSIMLNPPKKKRKRKKKRVMEIEG